MTGFALSVVEEGPNDHDESRWTGVSRILGPRWARFPIITVSFLGAQLLWSVEMSYASPYLLSLGLTKSHMAMVFLAGPLSGLIVQPLIGFLADNSKSRFGRRRPYIIGGSFLCAFSLLLLGYTRFFSSIFTSPGSDANDTLTVWLAVFAIYCMDFSVNAVQAMDRALVVDTLPTSEQAAGNAWAARMLGLGSVAGFFIGVLDLPRMFPFLGTQELQVLSVLASFFLMALQCITCVFVKERVLVSSNDEKRGGFLKELKTLLHTARTLPRVIMQICTIQFFAWVGWFPILFYTSVYVGELHKRASPLGPDPDPAAVQALEEEANRLGSRALFYSALLALGMNVLLPFFVRETAMKDRECEHGEAGTTRRRRCELDLGDLWTASHGVFAGCMLATFFTSSVVGATMLISIVGFSTAISMWAPFVLLANAILTEPARDAAIPLGETRTSEYRSLVGEEDGEDADETRSEASSFEEDGAARGGGGGGASIMGNTDARVSQIDLHEAQSPRPKGGISEKAGVILGIHNIFVVIPQFLMTGLSSVVFAVSEPGSAHGNNNKIPVAKPAKTVGTNSVAIIFRVGGVSALIAMVLCWRLMRELRRR